MSGKADAGVGIEAAASSMGLDFIPLQVERFDLAVLKEVFFAKAVQDFISILGDSEFTDYASVLGGYHTQDTGKILYKEMEA